MAKAALRAIVNMGTVILKGAMAGIRRIAEVMKDRIWQQKGIIQDEYQTVKIEEHPEELSIKFGTPVFVEEEKPTGVTPRKYKCPIWKYYSVTWVTNKGRNRPVMRELAEEIVSSGLAKEIIVNSIVEELRITFG